MLDHKPPIRIVEHHHALAREGAGDFVRLQDEQHLVILQRQTLRYRALFLPGEGILNIIVLGQRPMHVLLVKGAFANRRL